MKKTAVLFTLICLIAPAMEADARLTKKQIDELKTMSAVLSAEVRLTADQFEKFPLPENQCIYGITFRTGNGDVPFLRVLHLFKPLATRNYLVIQPGGADKVTISKLEIDLARWWGVPSDFEGKNPAETRILYLDQSVDYGQRHINFLLKKLYSKIKKPTVELRCYNMPAWVLVNYPESIQRIVR
ncbi:hypothetical protein KKC32_03005 [Patescibacteria group bacterium]|nr:hypothetical protein [Patescibacteria group bacterium]